MKKSAPLHIIAGDFKGAPLYTTDSRLTHPMGERMRNAIFNTISAYLPGADVLDLYAGTGALGFEALSRGAQRCVFVDSSPFSYQVVKKSQDNMVIHYPAIQDKVTVFYDWPVDEFLAMTNFVDTDVIFVDPPYQDYSSSSKLWNTLAGISTLMSDSGTLVLSHPELDRAHISRFARENFLIASKTHDFADGHVTFFYQDVGAL